MSIHFNDFLNLNLADIHYVRQKTPKGLGHAISCARTFVGDEPFAVLLGDDIVYNDEKPCLKQLLDVFDEYGSSVLGVQEVPMKEVSKYGIVSGEMITDGVYSVHDLVEKPSEENAPSNVAILGRYVITPEIFDILEKTAPGKGGEIQLTDALKELALAEKMFAYSFEGRRYDVGNKQGFIEATVEYALRKPELKSGLLDYLSGIVEENR